jgi:predicted transposase YbfD/YdcC
LPKKTFEVAAAANVALIVQIKDNQPTLNQHAHDIAATAAALNSATSRDKARGRDERRAVTVFDATDKFAGTDWHGHIDAIIRVQRDVYTRDSKTGLLRPTRETAFYAGNTTPTAARAAGAIRGHWKIETTCHYSRDVTMGEDASRIRTNPGVFARLRSFAYNILKANKLATLTQDRYRAALAGVGYLFQLLAIPQR